jgi:hypothetical protein
MAIGSSRKHQKARQVSTSPKHSEAGGKNTYSKVAIDWGEKVRYKIFSSIVMFLVLVQSSVTLRKKSQTLLSCNTPTAQRKSILLKSGTFGGNGGFKKKTFCCSKT